MIAYRALVGLAAIVTALLVQATVVGPLTMAVPVSLGLVAVLSVAVLAGPGTGIALGFGAGLLADLASFHPIGVLALTWMAGGLLAGCAGGMVTPTDRAPATHHRLGGGRFGRQFDARRLSRRHRGLRVEQCLLVGVLGALVAAATTVIERLVGVPVDALPLALARCVPAAAGDAVLALLILPVAATALNSPRLRPAGSLRPAPAPAPTFPLAGL